MRASLTQRNAPSCRQLRGGWNKIKSVGEGSRVWVVEEGRAVDVKLNVLARLGQGNLDSAGEDIEI